MGRTATVKRIYRIIRSRYQYNDSFEADCTTLVAYEKQLEVLLQASKDRLDKIRAAVSQWSSIITEAQQHNINAERYTLVRDNLKLLDAEQGDRMKSINDALAQVRQEIKRIKFFATVLAHYETTHQLLAEFHNQDDFERVVKEQITATLNAAQLAMQTCREAYNREAEHLSQLEVPLPMLIDHRVEAAAQQHHDRDTELVKT